jgi:predicted membrane-bound mannosyltransferase
MLSEWRKAWPGFDPLIAALIIFLFVNVAFYSSIFTNWPGVIDAAQSILMWTKRGVTEGVHDHAFHYYLGILLKLELPLAIAMLLGVVTTLWRGTRFGLFLMAWTVGITLAYSLIPYKTPWLMVSMLLPMSLLGGYAAEVISSLLRFTSLRLAGAAALLASLILCGRLAWRVNFDKPDDNDNKSGYFTSLGERLKLPAYTSGQYGGYVYAQTDRGLLDLVRAMDEAAEKRLTGKSTAINVVSPDHWPLPWYLRDDLSVGYPREMPDAIPEPMVIASVNQRTEVEEMIGPNFQSSTFTLRPGVELVLYVRE